MAPEEHQQSPAPAGAFFLPERSAMSSREKAQVLDETGLDRALIQRPLGNTSQYDVMPGDKSGNLREEAIWVDLAALLTGAALMNCGLAPTTDITFTRRPCP